MMRGEPWQRAEIPGPVKSIAVAKPEVMANCIRSSKRPFISIGSELLSLEDRAPGIIEVVTELIKVSGAITSCTKPELVTSLREKDIKVLVMPVAEVANKLIDLSWSGFEEFGRPDLFAMIGYEYYYSWLTFSNLKNFAPKGLRTLSLDPYYQPHANYSFVNLPLDRWRSCLEFIVDLIRGEKK